MKKSSEDILGFYRWTFDDIVEKLPDQGTFLEIGSYKGKSAVAWAEAFERAGKNYTIHCIDLFYGITNQSREPNTTKQQHDWLDQFSCTAEEQLEAFIENTEGWDNITYEKAFFSSDPEKFTNPFPDGVTVLWYDGFHSEPAVTECLNYWKDKSEYMIIDCYDSVHLGTQEAIDNYNKEYELFEYTLGTKGIALFNNDN